MSSRELVTNLILDRYNARKISAWQRDNLLRWVLEQKGQTS